MYDLHQFVEPIRIAELNNDEGYNSRQIGSKVVAYEDHIPSVEEADVVILGLSEQRGAGMPSSPDAANAIRAALYSLYKWHEDVEIADMGNVETGATLADSYAATKTIIAELLRLNKTVVLIGGSHDNTLAQYYAYKELDQIIEGSVIDCTIDLNDETSLRSGNFLMEMLTGEPNFMSHYNHIGFQSYFVHPGMLETMDKLRFDCYRVGMAKDGMEEMEPVIRNSAMVSFDISAIKHSDAPANTQSPNGFTGEEACMLARYAGMSNKLSTFGIYGYDPKKDLNNLTAVQIAQMLWYFIDGRSRSRKEASFEDKNAFNEFHIGFTEINTSFIQSKKTGRWWMEMPGNKFIPCSYKDYVDASNNVIPERWLRSQEREA
jgi:formiminoglutamase